jgi:integrase
MKVPVTVHGFRSSFKDWANETTSFPNELSEAALAHVTGDKVERAYRRGDALERRRELMAAWARFLEVAHAHNVVPLPLAR